MPWDQPSDIDPYDRLVEWWNKPYDPRVVYLSQGERTARNPHCLNCPRVLTGLVLQRFRCDSCLGPLCPRCKGRLNGICGTCREARDVKKRESKPKTRDRAAGSTEAATSASASSAPPTLPQGSEASFQILHSEEEQEVRHP